MEGVTNAVLHGKVSPHKPGKILFSANPQKIEVQILDWGEGFNLPKKIRTLSAGEEVSGRGLWILKNLMDEVNYRRGRPNRLILVRKLLRPKKLDAALELFDRLHEDIRQLKPKKHLYDEFIDFVVDLFNVERASFLLFDAETQKLRVATSRGIPPKVASRVTVTPGEGIAGYVFQTGRPLLVQNLARMKGPSPRPRQRGYHTLSFVSVPVIASPLHIGEETLGVLNLTDKRDGRPFVQEELKLLNLMAQQAAGAFRIRDLIERVGAHEGVKKEFEIVREIQGRLLPTRFPKTEELDIGAACQLSERGGGDYFDLIPVEDKIRGIIADVSGHHIGSAITMASFRAIFRTLVYDPLSPGELLQGLRWAMHQDLVRLHQFISAWLWEYRSDGKICVSGAGHPPLFHFQGHSKTWKTYLSQHLPLGLEDEEPPQNLELTLKPGDILFFYTDGLFDPRMRATGFDKQVFCKWVEGNAHLSAQDLVQKIIREVSPHNRVLSSPDDIAMVALKRIYE